MPVPDFLTGLITQKKMAACATPQISAINSSDEPTKSHFTLKKKKLTQNKPNPATAIKTLHTLKWVGF